jgi:hypothetical protein
MLTYLNSNDFILDASSTSKKTNKFYLIHHQSSLVPIKDLLNKNLNSNIEIIQMDEQDCILEIVDGAVTLVPKDQSSPVYSDEEKFEEQENSSIEYQTNNNYGKKKKKSKENLDLTSFQNSNILNK